MTKQQSQTEYAERMANDTAFRATEEYLDYCFAQRGHVRKPYWERWTGKLDRAKTKCKKPLQPVKARAVAIAPRPIICVETGEVYASARTLSTEIDVTVTTLKGYLKAGHKRYGKTYRYATEAEKGQL